MRPVVEQEDLLLGVGATELAAAKGVANRDRQRRLGRADRRAADAHPALDQGAEHREEAPVAVLDLAHVLALGRDLGVAVEQGVALDPDRVEPDLAVVDAVEADLRAVVGDPHAVDDVALLVPQGNEQGVDPLALAADDQLREDRGHPPVAGGVADVVLAVLLARRVDHELPRVGVVGRRGPHLLDVGAVAALAHREAARQLERGDLRQVPLVVLAGAEVEDRAAEEAELHADLDEQGEVAVGECLEARDGAADAVEPAELRREAHRRAARGGEQSQPVHDLLPIGLAVQRPVGLRELGPGDHAADHLPDLPVLAVEEAAQRHRVDALGVSPLRRAHRPHSFIPAEATRPRARSGRQDDSEAGAIALGVGRDCAAAVRGGDAGDDRQPEARPAARAITRLAGSPEALEDLLLGARR